MTVFLEVSHPFQRKAWKYSSELMFRCGWLWFAIGYLKVPFDQFCVTPKEWESD